MTLFPYLNSHTSSIGNGGIRDILSYEQKASKKKQHDQEKLKLKFNEGTDLKREKNQEIYIKISI